MQNKSDAITESHYRTKDLFTLCCSFVAMVLVYDVMIQVLSFLIGSLGGMDGERVCLCTCKSLSRSVKVRHAEVCLFFKQDQGFGFDLQEREIRDTVHV